MTSAPTVTPTDRGHEHRPPSSSPARTLWNWFGAVFGLVVLLGGGVLYVTRPGEPAPDAAAAATVATEQPAGHDEPEAENTVGPEEDAPAARDATEPEAASEPPAVEAAESEAPATAAPGAEPDAVAPERTSDGLEVIDVAMVDFGYEPAAVDLVAGQTVVLRFTNNGKLTHEAMLGDPHMQEEFAAAGNHDDGGKGDHHGDLLAVTVPKGETRELEVVIDEPGTWYMACHILGHYEAGQVATINVTA